MVADKGTHPTEVRMALGAEGGALPSQDGARLEACTARGWRYMGRMGCRNSVAVLGDALARAVQSAALASPSLADSAGYR